MSSSVPPPASQVGTLTLKVHYFTHLHAMLPTTGVTGWADAPTPSFKWDQFGHFRWYQSNGWKDINGGAAFGVSQIQPYQQPIDGFQGVDQEPKKWHFVINKVIDLQLKSTFSATSAGSSANRGDQTMQQAQAELNTQLLRMVGQAQMSQTLVTGMAVKPVKWTGPLPGQRTETRWQDPTLPWDAIEKLIKSRFEQHWLTTKFEPKVVRRVMDGLTGNEDGMPLCIAPGAVDVTLPSDFELPIDLPVFYDSASQSYSFELNLSKEFSDQMDSWNKQLLDRQTKITAGIDVPLMSKPDFSGLTPMERNEAEAWWSQAEVVQNGLPSVSKDVADKLKADLDMPSSATPEEVYAKALETSPMGEGSTGQSWWSKAWDDLKGAGAGATDIAKTWGPAGIVGAYAGYEVIKSAKKSTIPPWLILGGIGLTAVALLK